MLSYFVYFFAELPVLFIKKLENKTVQEEDTVELVVELSRLSTEIKWMKNGIVLQPEGNLKIQVDGVKQTLIFKSVTCADRGFYSCETLDDKTQAKLTVESKSLFISKHCIFFSALIIILLLLSSFSDIFPMESLYFYIGHVFTVDLCYSPLAFMV